MSLAALWGANSPATNALSSGKALNTHLRTGQDFCILLVPLSRLTEMKKLCGHVTEVCCVPTGILVLRELPAHGRELGTMDINFYFVTDTPNAQSHLSWGSAF